MALPCPELPHRRQLHLFNLNTCTASSTMPASSSVAPSRRKLPLQAFRRPAQLQGDLDVAIRQGKGKQRAKILQSLACRRCDLVTWDLLFLTSATPSPPTLHPSCGSQPCLLLSCTCEICSRHVTFGLFPARVRECLLSSLLCSLSRRSALSCSCCYSGTCIETSREHSLKNVFSQHWN